MRAPSRATATVVATLAIGVVVTSPSAAETSPSPASVELTRLIKLNVDNRPLDVAIPEIRRLVALASSPRPSATARLPQ